MKKKIDYNKITVLTSTFNRGHLLSQIFDSLLKQTNKEFKWIIIDDGSGDNTKEIVYQLIEKSDFEITYVYKPNGGKHTSINRMLDILDTELLIIVDSDDLLHENAIETILKDYNQIADIKDIGSIMYLKAFKNGSIVGDKFHEDKKIDSAISYMVNRKIQGDKCEVFLKHAITKYRFPEFEGERFIGETVVWIPLYRRYKSLFRNKAIYICEYLQDGLSKAGRPLRVRNPLGGMANSKVYIEEDINISLKIKNVILFACYGNFAAKSYKEIEEELSRDKLLLRLTYPISYLLYIVWKRKYL